MSPTGSCPTRTNISPVDYGVGYGAGFFGQCADMSVIPNAAVRHLNLQPVSVACSRGFGGSVKESMVFATSLSLVREEVEAARVLGWDEDYALVGRDLINAWRLVLNGPAQSFSLSR